MATEETEIKLIKALDEWEKKEGGLPAPLVVFRKLLLVQKEARTRIQAPPCNLNKDVISASLKAGQPLLNFKDLNINWDLFISVLGQVVSALESHPDNLTNVIGALKENGTIERRVEDWFNGCIESKEGDSDWQDILFQTSIKPFIETCSETLKKDIDVEQWRRGCCPVCGGSPDFGYLDKERGARYLLCRRCDTEWLFQRMECPFCGSQDQNKLAYYTDDSGLYRLYICDNCQCYLKTIDLRLTEEEVLYPLERFKTLDLDFQAREKGYLSQPVVILSRESVKT